MNLGTQMCKMYSWVMNYDALKVVCNENLKRSRNFGDIDTGRNSAQIVKNILCSHWTSVTDDN